MNLTHRKSWKAGRGRFPWSAVLGIAAALTLGTVVAGWAATESSVSESGQTRTEDSETKTRAAVSTPRPAPWNREPYRTMLDEITAMNRAELQAARRQARQRYPASRVGLQDDGLARAALLHMDRRTARQVGLSPDELEILGTRGGTKAPFDWGVFAGCFVWGCGFDDCGEAGCACHCVTIAKKPIPECIKICKSGIDEDALAAFLQSRPGRR